MSFTKDLPFSSKLKINSLFYLFLLSHFSFIHSPISAQPDEGFFEHLEYRSLGPSRGGRSTAVEGVPSKPFTFYMGTTGGGVWRTEDAGNSWEVLTDGQIPTGGIGAIAVAPSATHRIYVGTGSAAPRGNVSPGIGMYRSNDEGETWEAIGLEKAGQIGKIVVHPKDPDHLYVAALGNIFGPNPERGVFRSRDGGNSWEKVFYQSDTTGAIDLVMHPTNPDILYAAMWRAERKPWTLIDGGLEGGIWQSKDGGDSWEKLQGGLPTGLLGKIGLAISPANPRRIWALIQAAEEADGGLYRSDDGGKKWTRLDRHHKHRQRGWYYSHITADPQDENTLYSSNTGFYRSIDGGKSFTDRIKTPHGDNHGVWINPDNPDIMINCNDGGANVSLNRGKTWSTQHNQPTSEFYRISVDNNFPMRVYAGQQDNTTISVHVHRPPGLSPSGDWLAVGGSECADVAIDPRDPNIVYATSYSGEITYMNRATGEVREVTAYPHYTEGTKQRDLKYRWQWNFPIFISQYQPDHIYQGSNYVMRSKDKGHSWQIISPDLTRKLDQYHDIPGGPIQHDATGVEVYSSIFALEESPHNEGEIWVGTDDGRVHITRDGGDNWEEITPKGMPYEGTVNKIELSSHASGRALMVVYNYRYQDFAPYIYLTNNYGKSWKKLTDGSNGIPADHFVRAIAEDPNQKGLLYAGTEFGMYISFDEGSSWQPFQLNLPHTPITDMEVVGKTLVLSTQGRSFWALDDLSPLHQWESVAGKEHYLFEPKSVYRSNTGKRKARFHIYLENAPDSQEVYTLELFNAQQDLVRKWSSQPDKGANEQQLDLSEGMNLVEWDLRYPGPNMVDGFVAMVMQAGKERGPMVVPGIFNLVLSNGNWKETQRLNVQADPRWQDISPEDYEAQRDLALEVIELINESQDHIRKIRSVQKQSKGIAERAVNSGFSESLKTQAQALSEKLANVEADLYQKRIETSQDEINFPRKFSNHIARLYGVILQGAQAPTAGMQERYEDLKKQYEAFIKPLDQVLNQDLKDFNQLLEAEGVDWILWR